MKPFFSIALVDASQERALPPCSSIRVFALNGTLTIRFNDGDAVPVARGDVFALPFPLTFEKITLISAAATTATVIYGLGDFGGGGGGIGAGLTGAGSPEAATTADAGTTYYDTTGGGFWVKGAGSGNTGWVNLIA